MIEIFGSSDDGGDDMPSSVCASGGGSSTTGATKPRACPVTLPCNTSSMFFSFSSLATFSFSSLATRAPCFQFQLPCNTSSMFCLVFQFTFQFTQLAGFTS